MKGSVFKMEDLRKEFDWVREKFERNEIRVWLDHNSYVKTVFEGDDVNRKFECFLELFMSSLIASKRLDVDKYRGVGQECSECGKLVVYEYDVENCEILDYTRNSITNELERGVCTFVDNYSFEIEIPTGRIICTDRLPNSYNMLSRLEDTEHTMNSKLGLKEVALSYATENIFHVFVGNSCPEVFHKNDILYVGHSDDEECPPVEGAESMADICTDLWWASIVDVSVYENLLIEYFGEEQGKVYMNEVEPTETIIKAGVYKCTCFRKENDNDYYERPAILAKLEWIRDI